MLEKCPDGALVSLSGRPISQNLDEFWTYLQLLKQNNVRSYLEIGARDGDSLAWVIEHVQPERITVIDLPGGPWGRSSSLQNLWHVIAIAKQRGIDAELIVGDSRSRAVIERAKARGRHDAIFIDGDHTYEGVSADWANYAPLARKMVSFHDISGEGCKSGSRPVEVPALWQQIVSSAEPHQCVEIVAEGSRMGIGTSFFYEGDDMGPDGKRVVIYGEDVLLMKEIARQLRIEGHVVLIRSILRWQGDTESCDHVITLGEHLRLAAAYQAKGVFVEMLNDPAGENSDDEDGDGEQPPAEQEIINDNAADAEQTQAAKPKRSRRKSA